MADEDDDDDDDGGGGGGGGVPRGMEEVVVWCQSAMAWIPLTMLPECVSSCHSCPAWIWIHMSVMRGMNINFVGAGTCRPLKA